MQVTGLFFIHKINTPTKWSCDCCNSTLLCLQSGCSGAWNLSYYHLLTQAIMPILNWGTNQTVDMFKSFNTAWSSKVFYIKLITDNKDFSYEFVGWSTVPWSRSLFKMVMLCQFLCVSQNFEIFKIYMGQVWGMMTHIRKLEEITSWPGNRWHDAMYHEADH